MGTGTIKCLTVLCEAGLGASPAAPSPWATGKVTGQSRAPGRFARGFCHPPRCSAKQFITCGVSLVLSPRACLGTCEPPVSPGRNPTVAPSTRYANSSRGHSIPALPQGPQGAGLAPQQNQGIIWPHNRGVQHGTSVFGHECPDADIDTSPGAGEVASPKAFSSSVTPVRSLHGMWRSG